MTRETVPASDWTTYHHDALRTGDGVLSGHFTRLAASWTWHLPAADAAGVIFGSPLVDGRLAIVTTESDHVYAVSTETGKTTWTTTLGASYIQPSGVCGDIAPTIGVTSTPVIDEARNELFVSGVIGSGPARHHPTHYLFGISVTTGKVVFKRAIDPPGQDVIYLLQRAALALDAGRVLVSFGGNYGDCGRYHGWVEAVPESGGASIDRFEVDRSSGQSQGAVWMGGGAPTVDATGDVFVADGNGSVTSGSAYDDSDAVLKLSPTLKLLDWFAPSSWRTDNASDFDLGSGAPQLLSNGVLVQVGKTHVGYLLDAAHLGHTGATVPTFPVCVNQGQADGGDAIAGSLLIIPCQGGLNAVAVTAKPATGVLRWTTTLAGGPPVYAAGVVWSIAGSPSASVLYGLSPATGARLFRYGFGGQVNHFATPAVGANLLLAASASTLVAFPPR